MPNIESIIDALESLEIPASNIPYAIRDDSKMDAELRAIAKDNFIDSGRASWPELEYPNLRYLELENRLYQLVHLMKQVNNTDATDDEKVYVYESLEAKLQETQR